MRGGYFAGMWMMCGGYVDGVWRVYGWCVKGMWRLCGGCVECVTCCGHSNENIDGNRLFDNQPKACWPC